jgi:fucose permease
LAAVLQNAYGVSNEVIAAISLTYMFIFILFVFPTNIVLDKGGLKLAILVGFALTTTGMWVKCLINTSFYYVFLG